MSVFETMWKPSLNQDDAVKLCSEAIKAGIFNDLGSGSNVDVCVVHKEKPTQLLRNYIKPNERGQKERSYRFAKGTTAWLDEKIITKADIGRYITVQELGSEGTVVAEKMEVDS